MMEVNQSSGITRSYWVAGSRAQEYPALSQDIRVDVAIIGAGIAGLSAAYTLTKLGRSVAIIEDGLIGSGETSRTSAHLSSYVDGRIFKLNQLFGPKAVNLIVKSHALAIDEIEKIARDEEISCDFKRIDGYLFSEDKKEILQEEATALKGVKSLSFEWAKKAPFKNFDTGDCLKFLNQAQFHPLKYLQGLAKAIIKNGGQIFEGTHAAHIEDKKPCLITTKESLKVRADDVIVTTGSPINDRLVLQTKQVQTRTYVIGISLPKDEIEEALYWDTFEPYHYIRKVPSPKSDFDYVLIGGEDHRTGENVNNKEAFLKLKNWADERFSPGGEIIYQWSGQVIEPIDKIAFSGKNPLSNHIFVHTGTSGNGLTYGAIAGFLLPDLIMKKRSTFEKIYNPKRKTLKAADQFIKNTCTMVAEYADWLKPKKLKNDKLLPNEGSIVRHGLTMEAVFKDTDGKIHRLKAICPHLGGVVRWNSLEKTWDCPCHGSRFSSHGDVINGPANKGLTKIE